MTGHALTRAQALALISGLTRLEFDTSATIDFAVHDLARAEFDQRPGNIERSYLQGSEPRWHKRLLTDHDSGVRINFFTGEPPATVQQVA